MLITRVTQYLSIYEGVYPTLDIDRLEKFILARNIIPQEELYKHVWDFVLAYNYQKDEQIDFVETFRHAESFLLENEDTFVNNFILSDSNDERFYRKNLNADQIDQIFDIQRNQICWYEEFGFYRLGNYLFSRSIAVLEDSNFEVVLVIPDRNITLEFFTKNYVPTITSGFLIEGYGRLESRNIKSNLRDFMAKDEFLSSKIALVLDVPDVNRDDS